MLMHKILEPIQNDFKNDNFKFKIDNNCDISNTNKSINNNYKSFYNKIKDKKQMSICSNCNQGVIFNLLNFFNL